MEVLIPSVMALRETAMTAPLGQQGEPWAANGRPYGFCRDVTVFSHYTRKPTLKQGQILHKEFFRKGLEIGTINWYNACILSVWRMNL